MLNNISDKQIDERIQFLVNKMETMWVELEPKIDEFNSLKQELDSLFQLRNERLDEQISTRKNSSESSI